MSLITTVSAAKPLISTAAAVVSGLIAIAGNHRAVTSKSPDVRWMRTNHTGQPVTLLEGPVAVGALLAGVAASTRLGRSHASNSGRPQLAIALAASGSGLVGAYDDLYGVGQAKGLRGHFAALESGTLTSGMIKIAGVSVSALTAAALVRRPVAVADLTLDSALIAGTANLVNLCDLRPGRAAKVVLIMAAPLLGSGSAPVVGAAIGSLPTDLTGRSMLGDCGANALGAGVATAAAAAWPRSLRVIVVLAVLGLTLASEKFSFTAVIEQTPWLRRLDQWGRTSPDSTNPPSSTESSSSKRA